MSIRATILGVLATAGLALSGTVQAERTPHPAPLPHEHEWLRAHNDERADFGVAPLRWDPRLARDAQVWAQHLALEDRIRHSVREDRRGQGENLWMGTAGFYRPGQMIEAFREEKRHFRPGQFPSVSRTGNWADVGHYTQIVWEGTSHVGCASARGQRFDILVCRYWPAGNVIGDRIEPRSRVARR